MTKGGDTVPANPSLIIPEDTRMLRKQLLEWVGKRPIEPFRIHLKDGRAFDVRYPNMLLVMNTYLLIGIPEVNVPNPVVDQSVYVDITAVHGIELVAAPKQISG